ncbi:MAG: hypothetical protein V2I33_17295 [Kangiellaceae bacterium]|nr:hypothetical protein [Kangiellaceae bacterium]
MFEVQHGYCIFSHFLSKMNAYKQWVRAVWFENGREVEGVAPGTWIKRGTVFWPKGTNAEPAYLDREEPNEKTWRSFKLVKVKFTSGELL